MIDEKEFVDGLRHPVMKAIRGWLEKRVKAEQDAWASGGYVRPDAVQMALSNMGAVGRVQGYLEVLGLDYATYVGDMDEQFGFETEGSGSTSGTVRTGNGNGGGIFLPQQTRDRTLVADQRAIVTEIGNAAWADEAEPRAAVGDRVMLAKYAGHMMVGPADGKTYRMVNDIDIFAVITEETNNLLSPMAPSVGAKPEMNLALKGITSGN